ncbi:MAG TPA: DUF3106 domain-containing protein [Bryobacteraceae bacterium]|nr:DUF3106 domain-containing protein [Bryobacteraceae bacterium]
MTRVFQFGGLLWLVAAVGFGADQRGTPKAPPPHAAAPAGPKAPNGKGVPKGGGAQKGGAQTALRLANPGNLAVRLYQATPEQRERVIEKLPPARQEQARKQLEWFDSLPKEQQARVLQSAQRLASLSPERQREIAQSRQVFLQLPQDRRLAIRGALNRLQNMTPEQRNQVVNSNPFKTRFSPEEQKIIQDFSDIVMPEF